MRFVIWYEGAIRNSNVIVQRISRTQIYNKGSVTNFSFKRLIHFARNGELKGQLLIFLQTRLSTCFICGCFPEPKTAPVITSLRYLKSFCLRDRGRLGNEGQPILLKIGTQSRHVDLCNMPKFKLQRPFSSRALDISPSGVLKGWFSVQFWSHFNLSFSNVQLTSVKNKTIFVMPYP